MSVWGEDDDFPPVWQADPDGLLAVGGRLTPERVLQAYRRGTFPWPLGCAGRQILAWFSPDPRAVFELDAVSVSRRLARRIRSGCFRLTCDQAFSDVIAARCVLSATNATLEASLARWNIDSPAKNPPRLTP